MSTENNSKDREQEEKNDEAQLVKLLRDSTLISRTEDSTELLSPVFQEELYHQIQIQTRNLLASQTQASDPTLSIKLTERLTRLYKLLREGLVASRRADTWTVNVYGAAVQFYICHAKYSEGQTCCLGLLRQTGMEASKRDYYITLLLLSSLRTMQNKSAAFSELYYRYPLLNDAFILSVYDAMMNRNYVLLAKVHEQSEDDCIRNLLQCLLKETFRDTLTSHLKKCYHSLSLDRLSYLFELLQLDAKTCISLEKDDTQVALTLDECRSFPIQSSIQSSTRIVILK